MKPALRSTFPTALAICALHLLNPASATADAISEIEGNNSADTAQNLDGYFSLERAHDIGTRYESTSTLLPHVTIYGSGDGTLDYYTFTAKEGDRLVLDVDYSLDVLSMLQLFNESGTLLATGYPDDPDVGGSGSYQFPDAFLEFTAPETGRYVVGVGSAYSMSPVPEGSFYTLHISAGSPHVQVLKLSDLLAKDIPSVEFSTLGNPSMSSNGMLAVQAKLKRGRGEVTAANDAAIIAHARTVISGSGSGSGSGVIDTSRLNIIAREGDIAAGTANAVFTKFNDPICNDQAVTAFRGYLKIGGDVNKQNDTGIWSNQHGLLELIAREGEQAPGTAPGTLFHSFNAIVLPDQTGVAFLAKLRVGTGDATAKNNLGVWATDADGNLKLVIRKGMELNFGGTPRVLSSFSIFNSSSGVVGQSRHFTPAGSLLYRARFQGGGTGVFRYLP